jgi:hypothetical protein
MSIRYHPHALGYAVWLEHWVASNAELRAYGLMMQYMGLVYW